MCLLLSVLKLSFQMFPLVLVSILKNVPWQLNYCLFSSLSVKLSIFMLLQIDNSCLGDEGITNATCCLDTEYQTDFTKDSCSLWFPPQGGIRNFRFCIWRVSCKFYFLLTLYYILCTERSRTTYTMWNNTHNKKVAYWYNGPCALTVYFCHWFAIATQDVNAYLERKTIFLLCLYMPLQFHWVSSTLTWRQIWKGIHI